MSDRSHATPPVAAFPDAAGLLTDAEVRDILGISKQTLRAIRRSGALPYVQVRRHVRYRRADVQAYILAHRFGGPHSRRTT